MLARNHSGDILRTPPYPPELPPIAQVWGLVKSKLADSQDGHYTMASFQERLGLAFGNLTAETCRNIFAHVRKEEERYWAVDEQLDDIVSSG